MSTLLTLPALHAPPRGISRYRGVPIILIWGWFKPENLFYNLHRDPIKLRHDYLLKWVTRQTVRGSVGTPKSTLFGTPLTLCFETTNRRGAKRQLFSCSYYGPKSIPIIVRMCAFAFMTCARCVGEYFVVISIRKIQIKKKAAERQIEVVKKNTFKIYKMRSKRTVSDAP